jgi:mRNA interferase MazF
VAKRAGTIGAPRRGEVYLVGLDPTVGAEIKKTRPALILQNDIANRASPITIVAAITSRFEGALYPTEVLLRRGEGGVSADSVALLNQIRSVDKRRLVRRLGRVTPATMGRVDLALRISLGLVDL